MKDRHHVWPGIGWGSHGIIIDAEKVGCPCLVGCEHSIVLQPALVRFLIFLKGNRECLWKPTLEGPTEEQVMGRGGTRSRGGAFGRPVVATSGPAGTDDPGASPEPKLGCRYSSS